MSELSAVKSPTDKSHTDKSIVRRLLEMIRFSHTVFALPFALLACAWACVTPFPVGSYLVNVSIAENLSVESTALLAADTLRLAIARELTNGQILLRILGVVLCMISARSAAMAFNRLVDVEFDARNPRTAGRHLVSGELSRGQVWTFFAAMVLMFFLSCTLFLPNWLPLAGAVPVLLWICGYSLAKRFTSAAHLWLGVALALSPICAWIAMRGEVVLLDASDMWPTIGLSIAIACWVAGFDIIYACQDAAFDQRAGLHSLPARLGIAGALRFAAGLHVMMLLVLASLPDLFPQLSLGVIYWSGLAIVALLVIRQHIIIRPRAIETNLAPSNLAPSNLAPSNLAPSNLAPSNLAPSNLAPSSLAPSNLAPSSLAPSSLAPSSLAPSNLAPSNSALSNFAAGTSAMSEAAISEAAISEAAISEAAMSEAAGSSLATESVALSAARQPTPGLDLGRINEAFFQINALLSFSLSILAAIDAAWR